MPKCDPVVQRFYRPDEDAMVNALARILRFKPPDNPATNKTTSDKLAGRTLMVSRMTAKPTGGKTQ